ncbi:bifunctional tRNA (5-methylaminomethyl-2-thiouridine)(34)-methyltransferase MnmD/FAD-dependent 5-carboxymethylaminomethyl-2-thiouridine(34) oxidoreductase MnmC [Alteromonas sediminis]|uniref:tRNA 5-methylaminomethyl-2-thiouridine biosynthesis bifunctional protein MnmC n=2 Tax=Alteromonas sediminis TaxID=2259342 RepID=A0A3N5XWR2_9ALTE|nr:bifunctional tRNA (5-methylaminomethyl-2-thiouridine)(34)-methyltransferase MnmD/FAD-dependent 5-carboxymethylaminomethyl-2-thiouridine(34) oxidoreductase MnmC [Alteromonas sediminis]
MKIQPAKVRFNESGTPVADAFDDVYFSNDDGLAETEHVFLNGNALVSRWQTWQQPHFCIAETGFGTGLNCLLTIATFLTFRQQFPQAPLKTLTILSCEKFPLTVTDLSDALAKHPSLAIYADMLVNQYPIDLAGAHRLVFPQVTLDLWLGDVDDVMAQWDIKDDGLVDAWFLDGFAPSKNPQMWRQSLFDNMARLSKASATVATFTAAGFVRRGLIDAGFTMHKSPGFGRKREMLRGELSTTESKSEPKMRTSIPEHIAVIGGGLAGANMAYALIQKGLQVTLFCDKQLASGASGNAQGGFYPQLHAQGSHAARIQAHSFLFAIQRYRQLLDAGFHFAHDWCGVVQLAFSDQTIKRQTKLLSNSVWPDSLVRGLQADRTAEITGIDLHYPALYFPHGGWICPPELVNALVQACESSGRFRLVDKTRVNSITSTAHGVIINTDVSSATYDHLVLCTGAESHLTDAITSLPFRRTRGQVEYLPTQSPLNKLQTVVCHKGYLTPVYQQRHALGSTYVRQDTDTTYRIEEEQMNREVHQKALSASQWASTLQFDQTGRASVRMSLPDHQPIVGKLVEKGIDSHVSILSGLGSRGLTTAPLMSEILASKLTQQPVPLSKVLVEAVSPERYAPD